LGQGNLFPVIEVGGCAARVTLKRATNWYGTPENDDQTYNLNLAVKEFEFVGKNNNNEKCAITFDTFAQFQNAMGPNGADIEIETPDREVQTKHGKPTYVEVDDNWVNIGGHAHHRNICDNTRMLERREFFKKELDCIKSCNFCANNPFCDDSDESLFGKLGDDECPCNECLNHPFATCNQGQCVNDPDSGDPEIRGCEPLSCLPDCGGNGVAPCVDPELIDVPYYNFGRIIKHGLISWEDGNIYYTPRIQNDDSKFNRNEYKANLMLPTTIQELGSSVYCDIDDIPFIMDQIPPTTFNASYEEQKFKIDVNPNWTDPNNPNVTGYLRDIKEMDDKKNMSINLRAYVEFGCTKVICTNTTAPVIQSQVGVEMIDKGDIGVEIGACFLRFDHDDELRNYFCRRFNGYKAKLQGNNLDLSFHHQRPGSIQYENKYGTYSEIKLVDGIPVYYQLPEEQGTFIPSEYNDGDFFIPGDGCGYSDYDSLGNPTGNYDYFYGVAPGQTSLFINYPNNDTFQGANGTIDFGLTAQGPEGTDEIFEFSLNQDDLIDGSLNPLLDLKGVRFNRSQTPYYLYFGLVPGKTALHKTVGLFFADKIDAVTLEGLGASSNSVNENINNAPNVTNNVENNFSVYKK
jgi:hypothetical protein